MESTAFFRSLLEKQFTISAYEKARVLTEAARHYEIQGGLRDAYIKAADSIGTEYDRNRTLAAIARREIM